MLLSWNCEVLCSSSFSACWFRSSIIQIHKIKLLLYFFRLERLRWLARMVLVSVFSQLSCLDSRKSKSKLLYSVYLTNILRSIQSFKYCLINQLWIQIQKKIKAAPTIYARLNKTFETLWRAFHPKPTRISVGSSVVTGLFKSFASFVSRQWAKLRGYKELRATYEVNRSFSSKAFVEGICSPRKWVPRDELETYSYVQACAFWYVWSFVEGISEQTFSKKYCNIV